MTDWPHAPVHYAKDNSIYMVTAGTYQKKPVFSGDEKTGMLCKALMDCCTEFLWLLQAWAVFPNHYHFIALKTEQSGALKTLINKLHMTTAKEVNIMDNTPGRRIWFQYWDSCITFEKSYLARLNYVHNNPVHHGMVKLAEEYKYCSGAWFERTANLAFVKTVTSFKTDKIKVVDDF